MGDGGEYYDDGWLLLNLPSEGSMISRKKTMASGWFFKMKTPVFSNIDGKLENPLFEHVLRVKDGDIPFLVYQRVVEQLITSFTFLGKSVTDLTSENHQHPKLML